MRFQWWEDEWSSSFKSSRSGAILVLGALLVSAVTGCASVTLLQPLPATADATERARLEGEWIAEDQIIHVRFGSNGMGQIAGVDWKDGQFRLETGEITACRGARQRFLSVRVKTDQEWEPHYYFAQYDFTPEGDLLLRLPDPVLFDAAVQTGRLEGTVEKTDYFHTVEISSAPEVLVAFLNDPESGELFDFKDPMILKRLVLGTSDEGEPVRMPEGT